MTQQHTMTPGEALQAVAEQNAKLEAVDTNGYPLALGYQPQEWTTDADGWPTVVQPGPAPDAAGQPPADGTD